MKHLSLFILISLFTADISVGQRSILLNSGKRIYVSDTKIDSSGFLLYKNKRGKVKGFEINEVFLMTRDDGVEVIFYKPTCKDVCFKIDEMRYYLYGIADGREQKTPWAFIGGFAVGAGSGFLIPSFLSPVGPAMTSLGIGLVNPKTKNLNIPEKYKNNNHYIEGYRKSFKKKRITRSLMGGGAGLIVGIAAALIVYKN